MKDLSFLSEAQKLMDKQEVPSDKRAVYYDGFFFIGETENSYLTNCVYDTIWQFGESSVEYMELSWDDDKKEWALVGAFKGINP